MQQARLNKVNFIATLVFLIGTVASCTRDSGSSNTTTNQNQYTRYDEWIPSQAKTVLWVGAHPDDEIYVAPVLAELCKNRKMTCHLLVMTDGGKGKCNLAGGCLPTVAAVRDIEMKNSAQYYNAVLAKPNFEDSPAGSPDGVLSEWNDSMGGGNKLIDFMSNYIKAVNPDIVLTFDPRHGSSCHLDHRAIGRLVLAGVLNAKGNLNSVFFPQAVWVAGKYSESQVWAGNEVVIAKDPKVFTVDSVDTWQALIDTLTIHASQFPTAKNEYLDAFHYAPAATRISPLLHASETDMADPLYQNLCPFNDDRWPGR